MSSEIFNQTRAIKDLTAAVKQLTKSVEKKGATVVVNNPAPENYHDADTLNRVRVALLEEGMVTEDADRTINAILNAGILFRERR